VTGQVSWSRAVLIFQKTFSAERTAVSAPVTRLPSRVVAIGWRPCGWIVIGHDEAAATVVTPSPPAP
jgi:hypothetical protein